VASEAPREEGHDPFDNACPWPDKACRRSNR
jgi:hypothetical protein